MLKELSSWYVEGKIKPLIDTVYNMSELKDAYAKMSTRGVKGKLVMINKLAA